jgi:hypothetical protein
MECATTNNGSVFHFFQNNLIDRGITYLHIYTIKAKHQVLLLNLVRVMRDAVFINRARLGGGDRDNGEKRIHILVPNGLLQLKRKIKS